MNGVPHIQKNEKIDKVLVVGPNGNIGQALIPKLLALGYRVRALEYRSRVPERTGQEVAKGNTLDLESLLRAVDGVDAVCSMIRATGPGDTPREKWFNCCLAGAVNLLEAARQAKLERYVSGSADNVYGHVTVRHLGGSITETAPRRFADGYYGLFKILEDEMCRQYYLGHGVPIVITRFPHVWTESSVDGRISTVKKQKKIARQLDIDGKPLVRHDVHIDDAVQGILLALQRDEAVGDDFNIAAPAPYSSTEMVSAIQERFDYPVEDVQTDWHSWSIDSSKARSVLGYRPQVDLLEWLRAATKDR